MSGQADIVQVRIQAAATLSISEQYQRRSENCPVRLVGAILGTVKPISEETSSGAASLNQFVAEFRHSFPVPHSEFNEQVSINTEYYRSRMELHKKAFPRDSVLLGWYTIQQEGALPKNMTAATFEKNGEFIRDAFTRETGATGAPLTLNLSIVIGSNGTIKYEVFSCGSNNSQNVSTAKLLSPVPFEIIYGMPELCLLNGIQACLSQAKVEAQTSGNVLVSLDSLKEFKESQQKQVLEKVEMLKASLQDPKVNQNAELVGKINSIFANLGMTEESTVSLDSVKITKEKMTASIDKLEKAMEQSDELFLIPSSS